MALTTKKILQDGDITQQDGDITQQDEELIFNPFSEHLATGVNFAFAS